MEILSQKTSSLIYGYKIRLKYNYLTVNLPLIALSGARDTPSAEVNTLNLDDRNIFKIDASLFNSFK